jgi:hypothetical protein
LKARYLALFALAPALSQCQPACTPQSPAPASTTQAPTTTLVPVPYTYSVTCSPLSARFTAGPRDIVVVGGFGDGPTPQNVIAAGTSKTLPWQSFAGETYVPVDPNGFTIIDAASFATIDEVTLSLGQACPNGWSAPS